MVLAAVAQSAVGGRYKGKTGQKCLAGQHGCSGHEPVSFRISGAAVRRFDFEIRDHCPDGHTLLVHASGYPPMTITNSKFGGNFNPVGGAPGEGSVIKGRISGRHVTGSIKDTSLSHRENRLCHGFTRFSAHHV
jgi:hypothetical protein